MTTMNSIRGPKRWRRISRIVMPAIERLAQAASGANPIGSDGQLRACAALARLAPGLFASENAPPEPMRSLVHADRLSDEDLALLEALERRDTRESCTQDGISTNPSACS